MPALSYATKPIVPPSPLRTFVLYVGRSFPDLHNAKSALNPQFSMTSETCIASLRVSERKLRRKYVNNCFPINDIAREFSCSTKRIKGLLLKYKIPLRELSKYHKAKQGTSTASGGKAAADDCKRG